MTNIDQFESIFRSATKEKFKLQEDLEIKQVLIVSDQDATETDKFASQVKGYLKVLTKENSAPVFSQINSNDFDSVTKLLDLVNGQDVDVVCVHRNLYAPANGYPYSLGSYVDVLTQATKLPVLLLPRPEEMHPHTHSTFASGTESVMAVSGHLAGDHSLVNLAAKFTLDDGKLFLAHVEDQSTFVRYLDAIDKIPDIDSEVARSAIMEQLLSESRDYIESCREILSQGAASLHIETIVTVGDHIADYRRLITEHGIDLLVMHTKDEDQLAMHGLAYPLAVELRDIPLLLI